MPVIEDRGPPLREEEVVAFEARIGVSLPNDYRAFLLANNGGYPVPGVFRFASGAPGSVVQHFYGLRGGSRVTRLEYALGTFAGRLPPGLLPIATDPFGNLVCLGLEGSGFDGRIMFWDHEREAEEGEDPRTDNLTPVANTFAAFLAGLE